jgi:hypothetical protein
LVTDITERKQIEEEVRKSQEQLCNLAVYLQSARENERTAVAREIHDELGQALTGLKMDLSWMAKKIPEDQTQLLDKVHSMSELTGTTLSISLRDPGRGTPTVQGWYCRAGAQTRYRAGRGARTLSSPHYRRPAGESPAPKEAASGFDRGFAGGRSAVG